MGSLRHQLAKQFMTDLLYLSQHGKFNPMKLIEHYHDQNEQLKPERKALADLLWQEYSQGKTLAELNKTYRVDSIKLLHKAGYTLRPRGRREK